MRNVNTGPENSLEILREIVAGTTYKAGWTFTLREIDRGQGCWGTTLLIEAPVEDSTQPGQMTAVCHLMPVMPAAFNADSWMHWLMHQILQVERHEAMEFFKVNGHAPFFPEHGPGRDPYRMAIRKPEDDVHIPATPWEGGDASSRPLP